jgi:SagB-type dehydrogenase family enzyme
VILGAVHTYHDGTKHHFNRFARSTGYLDWASQPAPFRSFTGAHEIPLGPRPDVTADGAAVLIGALLRYSLGLSAWKQFGRSKWSLRVNPSSGNLHPTEAYALLPALDGIGATTGAYHYLSRDHSLELRTSWETAPITSGFFVAFTSIPWREAWKYGERAFRYCQHDMGHALAAVSISAATLGWKAQLQTIAPECLDWLLALKPPVHPLEPEIPEALVWIQTDLKSLGAPASPPAMTASLCWSRSSMRRRNCPCRSIRPRTRPRNWVANRKRRCGTSPTPRREPNSTSA